MANMEENKKTMRRTQESANGTDAEQAVFDQQKFLETLNSLVERAKKEKEYAGISGNQRCIPEHVFVSRTDRKRIGILRDP